MTICVIINMKFPFKGDSPRVDHDMLSSQSHGKTPMSKRVAKTIFFAIIIQKSFKRAPNLRWRTNQSTEISFPSPSHDTELYLCSIEKSSENARILPRWFKSTLWHQLEKVDSGCTRTYRDQKRSPEEQLPSLLSNNHQLKTIPMQMFPSLPPLSDKN